MSARRQRPIQQRYPEMAEDAMDHSLSESDQDDDDGDDDDEEEEEEQDKEDIHARIAKEDDEDKFITPLDILRVLFALSLFVGASSYFLTSDSFLMGYKPWFTNVPAVLSYFVRIIPRPIYSKGSLLC